MKRKINIVKYLRYTGRTLLILLSVSFFALALLSGSEELGGGLKGIFKNIPNALPWIILFAIVYVAWKWEFTGGVLIILFGLFTLFFFHAYKSFITLLLVPLPIIISGMFLFTAATLTKNINNEK